MQNPHYKRILVVLAIVFIVPCTSVHASSAGLAATSSGEHVSVTGLTAGGDAVVFTASISERGGVPVLETDVRIVRDEDMDGNLSVPSILKTLSICSVVDFATGRAAVVTPEGFAPETIPTNQIYTEIGASFMLVRRDYADVLLVRPGVGVWTVSSADGGAYDHDHSTNGIVQPTFYLAKVVMLTPAQEATGQRSPVALMPADVVIAIDPQRLSYAIRSLVP